MLRLIQIVCIALTAAILYGLGSISDALAGHFGEGFDPGFVLGMVFAVLVYLFICWLDPSSRPRGSSADQNRFGKSFD
ncbi:hypothetical protein [Sinorhizobium fredii]|uniref:hypothetical protein n=1 Tax=Rhizobium fredii TaxID=380 RepID=UPI003518B9BD